MKNIIGRQTLFLFPLFFLLFIWEICGRYFTEVKFMFSLPSHIFLTFWHSVFNGSFINDVLVTFCEASIGFLLSIVIGIIIGFILLTFSSAGKIISRYLTILSAIPVFAVAPIMIVWFGIGIKMKIATAFFSSLFIVIYQTYYGGTHIDYSQKKYILRHGATAKDVFFLLRLPSAFDWIIQSLRMSANLSVMGAFIGEFIASESGVGHRIVKASGLYNVDDVFVGIIGMVIIVLFFLSFANYIAKKKFFILRKSVALINKTILINY